MALDPSISLQAAQNTPVANPLAQIAQFAQLRNNLNQNQLFGLNVNAQKAIGSAFQQATDSNGNIDYNKALQLISQNPDSAFKTPEIANQITQRQNSQYELLQKKFQTSKDLLDSVQNQFGSLAAKKDPSMEDVTKAFKLSRDATPAELRDQHDEAWMNIIQGLGENPSGQTIRDTAMQQATQASKLRDHLDSFQKMTLQDTGGSITPIMQNQAAGTATVGNPLMKTPTVGEANTVVPNATPEGQSLLAKQIPGFGGGQGGPAPGANLFPGLGGQAPAGPQGNPLTSSPQAAPDQPQAPKPANALVTSPAPALGPTSAKAVSAPGNPATVSSPGAGFGQTTSQKTSSEHLGTDAADYKNELDENVAFGARMAKIIDANRKDLDEGVRIGGGQNFYHATSKIAQALGFQPDVVDAINQGDVGKLEAFSHRALGQSVAEMHQVMGATSKTNQKEFVSFVDNNPGLLMDPRAAQEIYNYMNQQFSRGKAEQSAMSNFRANGALPEGASLPSGAKAGDLTYWPQVWQGSKYMQDYAPETQRDISTPKVPHLVAVKNKDGTFSHVESR